MLGDILQYVSEVVGIQPTDSNKRAQLLRLVNRAAREIYGTYDLPNSVTDGVFAFDDVALHEISLPWYIGQVRAARYHEYGSKIALVSPHQRYQHYPWKPPFLQWRVMGVSPLEVSLSQATQLRCVLQEVETTPVQITIVGQTTTSVRTNEVVTIPAGSTEVTTTKQWMQDDPVGIESIQKSRITNTDVLVYTTVDDVRVAMIPNRALEAQNQILRLTEDDIEMSVEQGVQILYKKRLVPMFEDADVFVNSDYDDAIVWKVREHWYSTKNGEETQAILASQKCEKLIASLTVNTESATEQVIKGAPSNIVNAAVDYAKHC